MKESNKLTVTIKNRTFLMLFVLACIVGGYVAHMTADQYAIVARGILGVTVIFFMWLEFFSSKEWIIETEKIQLEIPKDLRYFLYGFIFSAIGFWAGIQILNLVWYLLRLISSG